MTTRDHIVAAADRLFYRQGFEHTSFSDIADVKATGWQQHSVRGFFAGVVCKKLGLILESDKPDWAEHRVYLVLDPKPAAAKSGAAAAGRRAA